jgi:hypothetical protein
VGADLGAWRRGLTAALAAVVGVTVLAACSSGATTHQVTTATTTVPAAAVATSTTTSTAPPPPAPPAPLTGLPAPNAALLGRPALSVKVDNIDDARPQAGLNAADMVTEELVEGGLTRLFATFHSQDAAAVGPIRSARPVDADLLRLVGGGLFAYSGAADGEIAPVRQHGAATLLSYDDGVAAFHRDGSRPAPHDVMASTADLYAAGADAHAKAQPPPAVFTYDTAPATGNPAGGIELDFSRFTTASWTWHPETRVYERGQNGSPDALEDGGLINATDVVVLSVAIRGTGIYDASGKEDPFVVVTGTGTCWLYRDGVMQTGTWSRPSYDKPLEIKNDAGQQMTLRPGRSWVELLPHGITPTLF